MTGQALGLFTRDRYFVGDPLTDETLQLSMTRLGRQLPPALVELLREQNGGTLKRQCLPVEFENSWAPDHIGVEALLGLGGERGMDSQFGSAYMIQEWGYPDIGVVFAATPSGGHDALMLNYTNADSVSEPSVVYIDEDRVPRQVAVTFSDFLSRLTDCDLFQVQVSDG